ncbi:MAG: ABC transporter permease [Spirochaetaceae bacterium]
MKSIELRIERVTTAGASLAIVALFLPFVLLKPNRVAEGELHGIADLQDPILVGALAGCAVASLALAALGESARIRFAKLVAGFGVFTTAVLLLAFAGERLITPDMQFARLSPQIGFWFLMLATFVIFDGSLRNATYPPATKAGIGLLPVAVVVAVGAAGFLDDLAVLQEFYNREDRFLQELGNHLLLSGLSVSAAVAIGVPLGLLAWRRARFEKPVFVAVNGIQTIPSLALFGLMIAPLAFISQAFPVLRQLGIRGIGNAPALIALTLYALLPITRNAYTSMAVIPRAVVDAGRGMGMGRRDLLRLVELPLAIPIILSGIRTSAVQAIGNTAVAALIGAGGLGAFVFQGLGQAAPDLIVMGVIPIVALAIIVDRLLGVLIGVATPRGIRNVEA